jgi:hypothetical protein
VIVKLTIRTSGGFGNIRLQGDLDTDELDSTLAKRTKSVLKPERLESLQAKTEGFMVDVTQFEVDISLEDGVHQYTLDEANAPPDVVEVLQALVHEIILKKRRT